MSSFHGKSYTIKNAQMLDQLSINRNNMLDAKVLVDVAAKVSNNDSILFLGNDVAESSKKKDYQLILHGILPCGSKTTLIIKDIYPYVDIKLRDDKTDDEAKSWLRKMENQVDNGHIYNIDIKTGRDFLFYDHRICRYARLYFKSMCMRGAFINFFEDRGMKTYSNDKSSYYRVVARDYEINLSGWNMISNYYPLQNDLYKSKYSFEVSVNDIHQANDESIVLTATDQGFDTNVVKFDNLIVASFDIEVFPAEKHRFADASKYVDDSIFMICITFHFAKRSESILNVCLTLKKVDPMDEMLIINCKDEQCLLSSFAKIMSKMQPDFITEYNGGGYDWKNIITKVCHFQILDSFLEDMSIVRLRSWEKNESSLNRYHSDKRIKINGSTPYAMCKGFKAQGFIGFDTMIAYKQIRPDAGSHKLKDCLEYYKLGSKDDLPIAEMFKIYSSGTSKEMQMVAHYCFIDTVKLQSVLVKANVIQERREVAILSYTSLHDNFFFAGGGRMRNLLFNRGAHLGYFFDTKYKPNMEDADEKYPGAYVVPPIKGIVKPMLRLDEFAALHGDLNVNLSEGYDFIEQHFEKIYHSAERVDLQSAPEFIRSYIGYANENTNQYPVSGLDFSSLYPSIIMAYNISPDKLVVDENYANELMSKGVNLQYVEFPFCKTMMRAWFVRHNNIEDNYSVCGRLLIELFNSRASIKKRMGECGDRIEEMKKEIETYSRKEDYPRLAEYEDAKFDYTGYDSKQKAVKIFMNTLYGEMGNTISCICAVEVAGSVTTMGRYNLKLAKQFVEANEGMALYYGDSVVGDTPIMIKRVEDGVETKELIPIEELDDAYEQYNDGKECIDYTSKNVYVMTEDGYSKVVKLIRHHTNKKLYRVTTHIGSVIVTEDHSLLDSKKNKVKPQDCIVGTSLLHWENNSLSHSPIEDLVNCMNLDDASDDIAYVKGFFFGDGSCGSYNCLSGKKCSFALNSQNLDILNKCIEIFNRHYSDVKLKVIDTIKSSNVYKAVAVGNVNALVLSWRKDFYSMRKHKQVPQDILNGSRATKLAFMQGYYAADGDKELNRFSNKGQIGTQGLYLLLLDLGYHVSVSDRSDKPLIYRLTFTRGKQRCKDIAAIKTIEELGCCDGYVYDLETESHHFAAGVGQMVVHNTDSLYVACNPQYFIEYDRQYFTGRIDKLTYGTKLVEETFEWIEQIKQRVNAHLMQDNGSKFLKMAYEEVLYPVAFLSKKKYYGVPHVKNVNFYPKEFFMKGLDIVKRNASGVLKDVVNEVIKEVLDLMTTRDIIDIVKDAVERVFNTKWPVQAFAKAKVLVEDKNNVAVKTMIRRYKEMNYHTIPEPSVRFQSVMCKYYPWQYEICGNQKKLNDGDRMELLERVIEEGLEIDLQYYFDKEVTGQLARLITFCKEFDTIEYTPPPLDTTGMAIYEIEAIEKENYTKSQEVLFNAVKKYVSGLASKYSNAYVNKRSLHVNTWSEVCKYMKSRPDLLMGHLNADTIMTHAMFLSATGDPKHHLFKWISRYILVNYKVSLSEQQVRKLNAQSHKIFDYINRREGLYEQITDFMSIWKNKVIAFIRKEYDYELIATKNLPYNTIWDVLDKDELEAILTYDDLFPRIQVNRARKINSMVISAIITCIPDNVFY